MTEEVTPRLSGVKEIMENLKQHPGRDLLVKWMETEIDAKNIDIVHAIRNKDIEKAQVLQATKEYVEELLAKPDKFISDASQKTIWEQAMELDGENHA